MKTIQTMKKQFLTLLTLAALSTNCTDHGDPVTTTNYHLDETSVAEWKGFLQTGYFNEGSIEVESNSFVIESGKVKSGTFTLPLASIVNFNLPTDELKHQLIHHLQSADFFNMALHPIVTFEIMSVAPYSGTGAGVISGANYEVTGHLTLLGKSNPVTFPARIDINGDSFKLEAVTTFDRTLWGMNYATEPGLPDDASIKPGIEVHLKLSGNKI
ncbi:Polyisoprenoid-binding protein YceI [Dyadobacter soli]|uniref:Polyisoprenoid-binding protein YceI n=2 Tax=Dyadobacter soli TaxID=659014 RepID=A0A1G8AN50_9BACT|nr:Polyisoprenoid-binding protein YceI [Dyadobacter soli]